MRTKLRYAVNDEEQFLAEFFFNVRARDARVLDRIVEESGGDRRCVHAILCERLSRRRWVDEVRLARVALLTLMRFFREFVRLLYDGDILCRRSPHLANNLLDGGHRWILYIYSLFISFQIFGGFIHSERVGFDRVGEIDAAEAFFEEESLFGFIKYERLAGARVLADFFYYFYALGRTLRFGEERERFIKSDGVGVIDLRFERTEFAVAPDIWAEASGRGEHGLTG